MFAIKTSYLQLADNEVHVWCTSFDLPRLKLEEAPSLLTMEEHARAARFYFEKDRNQYLVRRCVLRMLLGGYINMQPARVQIDYGVNGKPGVKPLNDGSTLQFNLSHSYSQAIYAFSWNRQVGLIWKKSFQSPMQSASPSITFQSRKMKCCAHLAETTNGMHFTKSGPRRKHI
jgi:4'-phosphopantetheinyl transferase